MAQWGDPALRYTTWSRSGAQPATATAKIKKGARNRAPFLLKSFGDSESDYLIEYSVIVMVFLPSFSPTVPSTVASLPPLQISLCRALALSLPSER